MHRDLWVLEDSLEKDYLELNSPRAPKFKKFILGIGWLDPQGDAIASKHAVVLGGIQTDDRLLVLDEHSGDIEELIQATIDLKDLFFAKEIYLDATDHDLMMPIWEADGLTRYISLGKDPLDQEIWLNNSQHWPHFRNRDNISIVIPVPLPVVMSASSGVNRLVKKSREGKLLVHPRCINVQWVLDQPRPADVHNHPIFRALIYLVYGVDRKWQFDTDTVSNSAPLVYRNLKK